MASWEVAAMATTALLLVAAGLVARRWHRDAKSRARELAMLAEVRGLRLTRDLAISRIETALDGHDGGR